MFERHTVGSVGVLRHSQFGVFFYIGRAMSRSLGYLLFSVLMTITAGIIVVDPSRLNGPFLIVGMICEEPVA